VIAARRLYLLAGSFAAASIACLLVAIERNDRLEDVFGNLEGAYFNRSSAFTGEVLSPFHIGNAYLWLGAGCALALAAIALGATALLARPASAATD
jgi:hypothetical protein